MASCALFCPLKTTCDEGRSRGVGLRWSGGFMGRRFALFSLHRHFLNEIIVASRRVATQRAQRT